MSKCANVQCIICRVPPTSRALNSWLLTDAAAAAVCSALCTVCRIELRVNCKLDLHKRRLLFVAVFLLYSLSSLSVVSWWPMQCKTIFTQSCQSYQCLCVCFYMTFCVWIFLIFLFVSHCCSTWYWYNTIGVCVAFSMCLSVAMVMSDLVIFFCFVYLFVSQSHCCAQCKLFVNQQLFVLLVHVWVGPHSGVNCYLCLCVFLYLALFVSITLL